MDHSEAEKMKAVERYVLGDLPVSEVEEFERHFFDCSQCSEELRAMTAFLENARAVFLEQDLKPTPAGAPVSRNTERWWSGWTVSWQRQWAVALGALLIGVFSGYLVFVERVRMVSNYPVFAEVRGEETIVAPSKTEQFYTLLMDRTWEGEFSSYRAVAKEDSPSAGEKFSISVQVPAAGKSINMLIPRYKLSAGRYVLVMLGKDVSGKETELARYPFTLRFE